MRIATSCLLAASTLALLVPACTQHDRRPPGPRQCRATLVHAHGFYLASARAYASAFDEAPELAGDLTSGHRSFAACAAILAASPGTADEDGWRMRALRWLTDDFRARSVAGLAGAVRAWKRDPKLALVRHRLDDLTSDERAAWAAFWSDVDAFLELRPEAERLAPAK